MTLDTQVTVQQRVLEAEVDCEGGVRACAIDEPGVVVCHRLCVLF